MSAATGFRCGTVVIAGRPNVGKSTLLNALVGQKLSIVTPKAQTTRHRIQGIVTEPRFQMILVDTPGAGAPAGSRLSHVMSREAAAGVAAADAALLIVAAPRWTPEDDAVLRQLKSSGCPIVLAVNKIDRMRPRTRLLPLLDRAAAHGFAPSCRSRRAPRDLTGSSRHWSRAARGRCGPSGGSGTTDQRFAAEVWRAAMLALSDELPRHR
jgi:small GTP-binding protein